MNRAVAALAAAFVLAAGVVTGAATASAHATLQESSPAAGEVLAELPGVVELTFDESVGTPAEVVVLDPDGDPIEVGRPSILDATMWVEIVPSASPAEGTYTVSYQATSEDGHLVSGSLGFSVGAPSGGSTSGPSQAGGTSTGASPEVVGLLGGGLAWLLVMAFAYTRRLAIGADPS